VTARRILPAGTVTFLFTDVEGSTRLLHELGDEYAAVLAEHRRALRGAFAAHGGVEVDTQGDAFFVAFPSPAGAIAAAEEGRRALEESPIRVRIGIHTGAPTVTEEGYVGLDVHKAARIAAAGHGGQIVVSGDTRAQLGDAFVLADLGEHRVKDFDQPIPLFQLGDETFPPLKTISNTNLPRPASSFVGRARELEAVTELVRGGSRLVTLTGPGGSGKTRLSIEAAAALVPEFRAGVFWVGLAPLRDARLVTESIAEALGAKDGLASHIADRELLLLLDNLEQVVDAAPELAALVETCPNLHLMVTSREVLRVRGEVEYPVLPLADDDAVNLFCDRARVDADGTVAELCRALDDLPLAVELAAARAKVLSPAQILERLSQRLDLFKGGRDADPRQQTLRATIAWSYDLLTEPERRLFDRLGVFAGGCTLEAAEEVAGTDLDTLQALVEKSLVRHTGDRFWMLETIREYAVERLHESGASAETRRAHADHFLALAERAEPDLWGPRQGELLESLGREHANLRAVHAWAVGAGDSNRALRLVGALRTFWMKRGHLREGRRAAADALALSDARTRARAGALDTASNLATLQGDWAASTRWGTECRDLSLELGELGLAAHAVLQLARASLGKNDSDGARRLLEEGVALASAADDAPTAALGRFNLGYLALSAGDLGRARNEIEAARAAFARIGDDYGVSRARAALGAVALHAGHADNAIPHLRESLALSSALEDRDTLAWALQLTGVAVAASDAKRAATLLGAAEALRQTLGLGLEGVEQTLHERALNDIESTLTRDQLEAAWAEGRDLSPEHAVEQALDE